MKRLFLLFSFVFSLAALQAQEELNVIYEEQFDGGIPADWDVTQATPAGAIWTWSDDGDAADLIVDGEVTGAGFWDNGMRGPIVSPSVANGCAMFNGDAYDNDGSGIDGLGLGPIPAGDVGYNGTLVSPTIDCSSLPGVVLLFNQFARTFDATFNVGVSNDDGATWTDFEINTELAVNAQTSAADEELLDISSIAANQPNVRIRFNFTGSYYFWLIDDVRVAELPQFNLAIDSVFYTPATFAQPRSFLCRDTFVFQADIDNIGSADRENVFLKAVVTTGEGTVLYEDSVMVESIAAGQEALNVQIDRLWVPENEDGSPLDEGSYNINYSVYTLNPGEEDFDPSDNATDRLFVATDDNLFSVDNGSDIAVQPGGGGDFEIGCYYSLPGDPCLSQMGDFFVTTLYFEYARNADTGPIAGQSVTGFLYKAREDLGPGLAGLTTAELQGDDWLNLVAFNSYEFPEGASNFDPNEIELLDAATFQPIIPVSPGDQLIATINYEGEAAQGFHAIQETPFLYENLTTFVFTSQWFLAGFGNDSHAVTRLNLDFMVNANAPILADEAMNIFPNPTTDRLTIDLALEAPTAAMIVVTSMDNKVIQTREFDNVQEEQVELNVSNLAAGTYIVSLMTEAGVKAMKFVKAAN
ncbi:MAG: T9SS type A sorting domain-containing protein [Bacteroidota bacterium]